MARGNGSSCLSVISIILLILVAGGLGYWNYTMSQTLQTLKEAPVSYYDNRTASFTTSSEDTYEDIPNLEIPLNVAAGEKVYVLFTCAASLTPVSAITQMHFFIKIDSTLYYTSAVTVGYTGVGPATASLYSVALQYVVSGLSAEAHTVKITTMRECNGFISDCVLFVQTYT